MPSEPLQPAQSGRRGGVGDDAGRRDQGEADRAGWVSQIAAGIVRHHEDDAWFHATPAFAELSSQLSALVREVLPDQGLRTWFLGHLLVELLLDAELISARPQALDDYYAALAAVDPQVVQRAVNLMAPRPAERLARFVRLFLTERFLCDYADDGKLAWRLEQVLRRAGLPPAGQALVGVLPTARRLVSQRAADLLTPHLSDPNHPPPASFLETGI